MKVVDEEMDGVGFLSGDGVGVNSVVTVPRGVVGCVSVALGPSASQADSKAAVRIHSRLTYTICRIDSPKCITYTR